MKAVIGQKKKKQQIKQRERAQFYHDSHAFLEEPDKKHSHSRGPGTVAPLVIVEVNVFEPARVHGHLSLCILIVFIMRNLGFQNFLLGRRPQASSFQATSLLLSCCAVSFSFFSFPFQLLWTEKLYCLVFMGGARLEASYPLSFLFPTVLLLLQLPVKFSPSYGVLYCQPREFCVNQPLMLL